VIKVFLEGLKAQGWTQKAIAEKVDIQPNMISKFMNGKTCTVETLVKFANAFNVTLDEVAGRTTPNERRSGNNYHGPERRKPTNKGTDKTKTHRLRDSSGKQKDGIA
jgi:transcriptional regulator with XRE-family HTH domain